MISKGQVSGYRGHCLSLRLNSSIFWTIRHSIHGAGDASRLVAAGGMGASIDGAISVKCIEGSCPRYRQVPLRLRIPFNNGHPIHGIAPLVLEVDCIVSPFKALVERSLGTAEIDNVSSLARHRCVMRRLCRCRRCPRPAAGRHILQCGIQTRFPVQIQAVAVETCVAGLASHQFLRSFVPRLRLHREISVIDGKSCVECMCRVDFSIVV